jgi:hypothetical protein
MKKIFKILPLLWLLLGCGSTQNSQLLRTFPTEPDSVPTSVDLSRYTPPPQPDLSAPVSVRTTAVDSSTGAAQAIIRQGVRFEAPFDGVCLNNEAEAVIEASFNEQIRNSRNEMHRAISELDAHALRDLQIMQNDFNLQRSAFQARIRDRDQEINSGNRIIQALERNSVNNIWYNIGWAAFGATIGIVASSVYLIVTH